MDTALDTPVRLFPLTYVVEGDEVTVGSQDAGGFGVFPPDGAALARKLEDGLTPRAAAEWYLEKYGEQVDIGDFVELLAELGLVRPEGESTERAPLRWRRLGTIALSRPALAGYAGLFALAVVLMVRSPDLAPHWRNLFFTDFLTVVVLGLFIGQFPFLLQHEAFHMLAGRRIGLRSRLGISRRFNYLVFETSMDGLVGVPRKQRYLPMLAGLIGDVLSFSVLTIVAALSRNPDGTLPLVGRFALGLAFFMILRMIWQLYFFLRTDLYYVISVTFNCVDLHTTSLQLLRNRFNRLLGRTGKLFDESRWHPRDYAVARWYSWGVLLGYSVLLGSLLIIGVPTAYHFFSSAIGRLVSPGTATGYGLVDSVVFLLVNVGEIVVVIILHFRERRSRQAVPSTRFL